MPKNIVHRKFWFSVAATAIIILAAFWITAQFVQPAPPRKVVIAAAPKDPPYYPRAAQYQRYFAEIGVTLEIRETFASVENLKLLNDPKSGVDIGFVQGGLATGKDAPTLRSMGRVAYEPLWVFYRGADSIDRLSQL